MKEFIFYEETTKGLKERKGKFINPKIEKDWTGNEIIKSSWIDLETGKQYIGKFYTDKIKILK